MTSEDRAELERGGWTYREDGLPFRVRYPVVAGFLDMLNIAVAAFVGSLLALRWGGLI